MPPLPKIRRLPEDGQSVADRKIGARICVEEADLIRCADDGAIFDRTPDDDCEDCRRGTTLRSGILREDSPARYSVPNDNLAWVIVIPVNPPLGIAQPIQPKL